MTIDDKISNVKLQYNINREAAKIPALSSGNIDKYEDITGEEILPSDQRRVIEQAQFICFPLRKALEKQAKAIGDQGEKLIEALEKRVKQLCLVVKKILQNF